MWKHRWTVKKAVAEEIDEREKLYVEQAKSLDSEIKILTDELKKMERPSREY